MNPHPTSDGDLARVIWRDRFVQLFLAVFAVEAVVYAVPLLSPEELAEFGASTYLLPFVAVAVLAAIEGLHVVGQEHERMFWKSVAAGFVMWLVTLAVVSAVHASDWTVMSDALSDAAYMLFYAPVLMGLEYRPHVPIARLPRQIDISRRLRWVGLSCLFLGWYFYFVVVPVWIDPAFYDTMLPSAFLFMTADVVLIIRLVMFAAVATTRRWRVIYGTLAIAAVTMLGTDALDAAISSGLVYFPNGAFTDALWVVPPFVFVLAFRARNVSGGAETARPREQARNLEPERAGSLLISAAASFPIAHLALQSMVETSRSLQRAQDSTALLGMLTMAALAAMAYFILERDRHAIERAHDAMELRLREAATLAAVSRLAAVAEREIGPGVAAARVQLERARDGLARSHPERETLQLACESLDQVLAFTQRLRALSRQIPLRPAPRDLNTTIADSLTAIRDAVQDGVTVDLTLSPSAGTVLVDADALRGVLVTLARNAREAMPQGGTLAIETRSVVVNERDAISRATRPGRYGRIDVTDTGAGMSADKLAHVFEPCFSTFASSHGRGLGLATAHAIVSQHGGAITAASEPECGATFEILLPAIALSPDTA